MDDNYPSPGPRTLLAVAVALEGGLGALAVAVGWIVGCPTLESIRLTWPAAVAGIAAGLPMLLLLWACVRVPLRPLRDLLRVMDQIIVPLFRGSAVWHLAVIAALAG